MMFRMKIFILACLALASVTLAAPKHQSEDAPVDETGTGGEVDLSPPKSSAHVPRPSHLGHPQSPNKMTGRSLTVEEPVNTDEEEEPWRVCYYTNWSQYRPEPGTFWPEDMDPSLCTHIYYAFSDLFENRLVFYEINDIDLYGRINAWKTQYPTLKTVLAVGGWTHGTAQMSLMLSSQGNRTEFVLDVIQTLTEYNFNGIDLDFEYPGGRGSPPQDKYLYTCLLKEMRAAFDAHNAANPLNKFTLTAGVAAGLDRIRDGYEVASVSKYLDKVILMAYDFFGAFDNYTNPHTPMRSKSNMKLPGDIYKNVDVAVSAWLDGGCPRHKLVLGLATYGRGFTLQNRFLNGLEAPMAGPSDDCNYTRTLGFCAYYELCFFWEPFATVTFDDTFRVPWGYNGDQWFGYENVQSAVEKVMYMKEQQLGGVMIWTMDDDDFSANGMFCREGQYPMIRAINAAIGTYRVPVPAGSLPDPDFCQFRPDGYYQDMESCERYYRCTSGQTTVGRCPVDHDGMQTIYDPFFHGCRRPTEMDQTWICSNCIEYCDRFYCD